MYLAEAENVQDYYKVLRQGVSIAVTGTVWYEIVGGQASQGWLNPLLDLLP
jgi:hypothetical protein